jgi:hypothetical protein
VNQDAITPRLLSREQAGLYAGCSADAIDRLINAGHLSVVSLPAGRARNGGSRRVLIDRFELDELIPKWREKRV